MEDFLKKILPVPNEILAFRDEEEYKRFKKAKKKYEIAEFYAFTGKIIKDKRKELGISASSIASALDIAYNTYFRYENGNVSIPAENLFKIAKILNISLDETMELYNKLKKFPDNFNYFHKKKI